MILDNLLRVAENVTMSVLTTETVFPDSIDTLKNFHGAGEEMGVVVTLSAGATTPGVGVGAFIAYAGATANALTTEIGRKLTRGAEMIAGSRFVIPLGPITQPTVAGRFISIAYVASANHTGAIASAFIEPMSMINDRPFSFPSGFVVL